MRRSNWTPSIVPTDGQGYCLVIDDLGYFSQLFREADVEATSFETVVMDLLEGQYSNPVRVVSFNTGEGWSRDISADVAAEVRKRCDLRRDEPPNGIQDFLERHGLPAGSCRCNSVSRFAISDGRPVSPICLSNLSFTCLRAGPRSHPAPTSF
jgi:hypothetical protein